MQIGDRSLGRIARAPFQRGHWRAAAGMLRTYPDLVDSSRRFLTCSGDYPHDVRVRTPLGIVSPTLSSQHDMSTVNEVFCRRDYEAPADLKVAVDVGSNIGISALYFLTRNASARVYAFEPDPKNIERLHHNLRDFNDRYELDDSAVALTNGTARFGVEPVGRYGTLNLDAPTGHPATEIIEVRTRALNDILAGVLEKHPRIDILKIDVEGIEEDLVGSISPELLDRIDVIVYETDDPAPMHTDSFKFHFDCQTNRLERVGQP
jgi:FkbM family methyltransferase